MLSGFSEYDILPSFVQSCAVTCCPVLWLYCCAVLQVLDVLSTASEYDELPVRHNEDVLNTQLAQQVMMPCWCFDSWTELALLPGVHPLVLLWLL